MAGAAVVAERYNSTLSSMEQKTSMIRLHILKLKDTILREPAGEAAIAADLAKNADCSAQLVNALDQGYSTKIQIGPVRENFLK
jgi:hypothetical protein